MLVGGHTINGPLWWGHFAGTNFCQPNYIKSTLKSQSFQKWPTCQNSKCLDTYAFSLTTPVAYLTLLAKRGSSPAI